MPIKIFYCYAHEDKALRVMLEKHLGNLRRQKLITGWSDQNIDAGREWEKQIDNNLNTANIILLLISPDFMHSDFCYSVEMTRALERHKNGTARVIPIILRHVEYEGALFSSLQALPTGAVPVTDRKWHNRDEAFFDVAQGIRKVVKELLCGQWLDEGYIHFYRDEYEEALALFERTISIDPTNALAYIGQGQVLFQFGLKQAGLGSYSYYEKAFDTFEQATYLDETNAQAYAGKGRTLLELSIYKKDIDKIKILEVFEQAIRLDPKNEEAYIGQGDVFMDIHRFTEAVTAYGKAFDTAVSFNSYACGRKGDALFELELYEEAIENYNRVLREFPETAYIYKRKGDALYKLERYKEALAAFEQAIGFKYYQIASVYSQKGNTLAQLSRLQEALAAYEQAIQLGSDIFESDKAEAYRGKGNILQSFAQVAFKKADALSLPDLPSDNLNLDSDELLADLDEHPF